MSLLIFIVLSAIGTFVALGYSRTKKKSKLTPEQTERLAELSLELDTYNDNVRRRGTSSAQDAAARESQAEMNKLLAITGGRPRGFDVILNNSNTWLAVAGILGMISVSLMMHTSMIFVADDQTAQFTRQWGGEPLKNGEVIARKPMSLFNGVKGPQSEVILPGYHFRFMHNVVHTRADKEMESVLKVPAGKFAVLVARDGIPMTGDRMLADAWKDEEFNKMLLDAGYFLNNNGMKGLQYTVVPSGTWHINRYLWEVDMMLPETKVGTGQAVVIRSNIQLDPTQDCTPVDATTKVPLVPNGCRGVWAEALGQGTYRFNPRAVGQTIISIRQNTNDHLGNYTRKKISFNTDNAGNITPALEDELVERTSTIDDSIDLRAEGWNIDQDLSTFWQVENAPKAVADLGGQEDIAQFVSRITQSEFRIVAQGKDSSLCSASSNAAITTDEMEIECLADARQAMDLIYKRAEIESAARDQINLEIQKYGVVMNKVTMGRPNIPPELLMPVLRTQYAEKMQKTLKEEEETAKQRIAVQNANELANHQSILVEADLNDQASTKKAAQVIKLATARKSAAELEAKGQRALVSVMGSEKVQEQILVQKTLDAMIVCPSCVKVPEVLVQGGAGGSGMEGFAAVLGHSNIKSALISAK